MFPVFFDFNCRNVTLKMPVISRLNKQLEFSLVTIAHRYRRLRPRQRLNRYRKFHLFASLTHVGSLSRSRERHFEMLTEIHARTQTSSNTFPEICSCSYRANFHVLFRKFFSPFYARCIYLNVCVSTSLSELFLLVATSSGYEPLLFITHDLCKYFAAPCCTNRSKFHAVILPDNYVLIRGQIARCHTRCL